jgi:hypothetical protein
MRTIQLAAIVVFFFVAVDLVWLGLVMPDFYSEQL